MELGEKIRQARLEAGLSQRQLCADTITRNMLSQIENGSASPSVATLRFLARGLGRPVSFFLEEDAAVSANQRVMEKAWEAYERGDFEGADQALAEYRQPDPVYCREQALLESMTVLALARKALEENRKPYARELMERLPDRLPLPELEHRRGLLQLELGQKGVCLPDLDRELTLRAKDALASGEANRAARLLDAVGDRQAPDWCLLRGRAAMALGAFREAVDYLIPAEEAYPKATAQALELCWRELGDFRNAYTYACKARSFLD